jgi:hypothetical protein
MRVCSLAWAADRQSILLSPLRYLLRHSQTNVFTGNKFMAEVDAGPDARFERFAGSGANRFTSCNSAASSGES